MYLLDQAGNLHIGIQVVNGGYVCHGLSLNQEDNNQTARTTSIFSDVDSVCRWVQRIISPLEGPGELHPGDKIGGIEVPA